MASDDEVVGHGNHHDHAPVEGGLVALFAPTITGIVASTSATSVATSVASRSRIITASVTSPTSTTPASTSTYHNHILRNCLTFAFVHLLLELNLVSNLKSQVTGITQCCAVNKDIIASIVRLDEAKTPLIIPTISDASPRPWHGFNEQTGIETATVRGLE
eukprot:CAMPEP_0169103724 /NCGR_PEP_ID=MMETSP1015-20121227/22871_1 /TAXON_ID=342587 /ORGANISM="Karlodinium micrum, Strain CCMP2283" /LENGTH=160 /DNA_ID=CAMNT_0009164947 /DNA_START=125 /DNA_END=605 /DNA_ORIENTATION=-